MPRHAQYFLTGVMTPYVYDDAGNRVQEATPSTGSGQAVTTYYLTDTANPTGYAQLRLDF